MANYVRIFEIGYDLDASGDTVVPAPEFGARVVQWTNFDFDVFPFPNRGGDVLLIAVDDIYGDAQFPETFVDGESTYHMVDSGQTLESDHECLCAQTEPDCDRCGGDGYVVSPATTWALYEEVEEE